ncbi:very short patch repair endonuclease [Chloroflexota bacterium]
MTYDSKRLAKVKSKNTKVELTVRRMIYSLGVRYRLHDPILPGHPDIVFRGRRKVIFVNGCFWHRHQGCRRAQMPKTKLDYWVPKFSRTIQRDKSNYKALDSAGWQYMIIWECELSNKPALIERIQSFLKSAH